MLNTLHHVTQFNPIWKGCIAFSDFTSVGQVYIIHLHLFQALLLLPCMLLVDLLGEQLASLVCVHEILAELVTFLTEAVKRPSHYSGLSLKLKIDE